MLRKPVNELATTTDHTLRMLFRNQEGKNVTITLNNPKDDLTTAEIETAMDLVIAKNIFTSTGGDIVAKQDIRVISNTTNDLYDPPA